VKELTGALKASEAACVKLIQDTSKKIIFVRTKQGVEQAAAGRVLELPSCFWRRSAEHVLVNFERAVLFNERGAELRIDTAFAKVEFAVPVSMPQRAIACTHDRQSAAAAAGE
jgi:hypothetical protein